MLRLERRQEPSRVMIWTSPVLAVALTLVTGFLLFVFMGYDPVKSLVSFFVTPVSSLYGLSELGVKATPILLCAVGLAIGFRAGVWNIGAEGQLTMGAIAGGGVALYFGDALGWFSLPVMCMAGILGGMAWAAIPAFLKTRLDVNEILVSLMLTYVAALILSVLIYGPWKDPMAMSFPQSRMFNEWEVLPIILPETRLHLGAIIALVVAFAAWVILGRTLAGFQVKVIGAAPLAARFAGFSQNRIIWGSLLASGGLAGLAGIVEVAGPIAQIIPRISPGYGFTAIIVAFLGRLHPLGVIAASLLMAVSYIGGENAQVEVGMPQAVTGVFQGLLLFYVLACDVLITYRIRVGSPAARAAA